MECPSLVIPIIDIPDTDAPGPSSSQPKTKVKKEPLPYMEAWDPNYQPIVDIPTSWAPWFRVIPPETSATTSETPWGPEPELNMKAVMTRNRYKFTDSLIEEGMLYMFVDEVKEIKMKYLWDIADWTHAKRQKFRAMMKYLGQGPTVRSQLRINRIKDIDHRWCMDHKVMNFIVERRGAGTDEYFFSEADFPFLNLIDIIDLYLEMRNYTIKPGNVQDAEAAVKRFMKFSCRHYMLHDFQLALESEQRKVNLTKPSPPDDRLAHLPNLTVINEPKLGLVYKVFQVEKKMLWLDEVNKHSDGTLKLILFQINERLAIPLPRRNTRRQQAADLKDKLLLEDAKKRIEEQLMIREAVRSMERMFGFRPYEWTR